MKKYIRLQGVEKDGASSVAMDVELHLVEGMYMLNPKELKELINDEDYDFLFETKVNRLI